MTVTGPQAGSSMLLALVPRPTCITFLVGLQQRLYRPLVWTYNTLILCGCYLIADSVGDIRYAAYSWYFSTHSRSYATPLRVPVFGPSIPSSGRSGSNDSFAAGSVFSDLE